MDRFLCISVRFLTPFFHGRGDGDKPEWPPSPMRLFQALLAGSKAGWRKLRWSVDDQGDLRGAFLWLERQCPPEIVAPEARDACAYTLFVPNNDSDKILSRQDRLTSKVARPLHHVINDDLADAKQALHYLWPIPEEEWSTASHHAQLLSRESQNLMALGWGIDQVVGNGRIITSDEASQLLGERWQPWPDNMSARNKLRVPKEGSLEDLDAVYASFCARLDGGVYNPPQQFRRFKMANYVKTTQFPHRSYAYFELPKGTAFRQEAAIEAAAMLRSLACCKQNSHDFRAKCGDDPEVYLAGHVNGKRPTPPRFSYLPLPTIGHDHADGMIRRLMIAEPWGGDGSRANWAQTRLEGQVLLDNDRNERGQLLELWQSSSHRMIRRYVGDGRIWSTVTPIILPGFDDSKRSKATKLILQSIKHAGLQANAIADLTMRKAPFWKGAQHPRNYRRPHYLKHFSAWHVQLEFHEPVSGPLAIGAGRHVGLGLLAQDESD